MLLITDKRPRNSRIADLMRAAGPCHVVPLHDVPKTPIPNSLVVCDVALENFGVALLLRDALRAHRGQRTPLIFITDGSYHRRVQALALGATAVLKPDASPREFYAHLDHQRSSIGTLVEEDARGAAMAMADVFDSMKSQRAIPGDALSVAVGHVTEAVVRSGLQQWLEAVWLQDDHTYQHCLLVAGITAAFCAALGFSLADRAALTEAALLHDVGKSKLPLEILHSPNRLSGAALEKVREHPRVGYELLLRKGVTSQLILDVVLHHHEFLDGTGYPEKLSGLQILDPTRIITICDIFAALVERRSYKPPMPVQAAYEDLASMHGKLDPDLVRAFHLVLDQCTTVDDLAPVE